MCVHTCVYNIVQSLGRIQHFCVPMACSLPGSSVHGISEETILEWVAISFSRGSSRPWDQTGVSCITCGFFFTTEPLVKLVHSTYTHTHTHTHTHICTYTMCLCMCFILLINFRYFLCIYAAFLISIKIKGKIQRKSFWFPPMQLLT